MQRSSSDRSIGRRAPRPHAPASAWGKYRRAQHHVVDLLTTGNKWGRETSGKYPPPIDKRVESVGDGSEVIVYSIGQPRVDLPEDFKLILGDVFSNFRAALDHLAWAMVTSTGAPIRQPRAVSFPIFDDRAKYSAAVDRMLPNIGAPAKAAVQRLQPFNNKAQAKLHPLYLLNDAVGIDKHRTITVVALTATNMRATPELPIPNFDVSHAQHVPRPPRMLPGLELLRIYGRRPNPDADHGVKVRWHATQLVPSLESGDPVEELAIRLVDLVRSALLELGPFVSD